MNDSLATLTGGPNGGWIDDSTYISEYKLYDMYGTEKLSLLAPGKEAELPTQQLLEGPYVLRVRRGQRLEIKRIQVDH